MKVFKMYAGTMHITSETFQDAYEDSASPEFSALAAKVQDQVGFTSLDPSPRSQMCFHHNAFARLPHCLAFL